MARVVTPWGLDLGDVPDGPLLAYYRAEGYTVDGGEPEADDAEHASEVQVGDASTDGGAVVDQAQAFEKSKAR